MLDPDPAASLMLVLLLVMVLVLVLVRLLVLLQLDQELIWRERKREWDTQHTQMHTADRRTYPPSAVHELIIHTIQCTDGSDPRCWLCS